MKERILFLLIVGMILTGCGQGEKERVLREENFSTDWNLSRNI